MAYKEGCPATQALGRNNPHQKQLNKQFINKGRKSALAFVELIDKSSILVFVIDMINTLAAVNE